LVPGQFVRISVLGLTVADAIVVPPKAVIEGPLGPSVYVLDDKSVAQTRPVRLGAVTEQGQAIQDGLKAGERIVVDGIGSVKPGSVVREGQPAETGAAAAPAAGGGTGGVSKAGNDAGSAR